jgi:hypothetical protein
VNKKVVAALGVVGGAIALFAGGQAFVSHAAAKEVDKAIDSVSEFVEVDYKKVKASLLGGGTHVRDLVISPVGSGEEFKVDEVVVYKYDTQNEIPTHVNMAVNGMVLDIADTGGKTNSLKEFGYDKPLLVNVATEYQYQEAEKEIHLKKFKMGAKDMGDMDLSVHLSNVSLDPATMASMPFALFGVVFHSATFTYDDDSLMTRMFDSAAAAQGVSVEAFKKEAIASIDKDLASGEAGVTKEVAAEMKKFIQDPSGFSVSMEPEKPVPVSDLMATGGDPNKIIELLNIRFKS